MVSAVVELREMANEEKNDGTLETYEDELIVDSENVKKVKKKKSKPISKEL